MEIEFIAVDKQLAHAKLLYALLQNRQHSISHSSLPSFDEHYSFVLQHPYRAWFLVFEAGECKGHVYLQNDNSIGINISDEVIAESLSLIVAFIKQNFNPLPAIKSVRNGRFHLHVSPTNTALINAVNGQGYQKVQVSYLVD